MASGVGRPRSRRSCVRLLPCIALVAPVTKNVPFKALPPSRGMRWSRTPPPKPSAPPAPPPKRMGPPPTHQAFGIARRDVNDNFLSGGRIQQDAESGAGVVNQGDL